MKRFDHDLYKKNDNIGKMAVIYYLLLDKRVNSVRIPLNKYQVDIQYTHKSSRKMRAMEAEVKRVWKGGKFPYDSVDVLHRKAKYFEDGADLFLLSDNRQDYVVIKAKDILVSPVVAKYTKYTQSGEEKFFRVALDRASFGKFKEPINASRTPVCNVCQIGDFRVDGHNLACVGCNKELL